MTALPLRHLSICRCGFTMLRDEILLGTIYHVDLKTESDALYICGGCGVRRGVRVVKAHRDGTEDGIIPLALFIDPPTSERVQ